MPKDFHFGVALLGGYEKTGVSSSQVKNIDRTTTILWTADHDIFLSHFLLQYRIRKKEFETCQLALFHVYQQP